MPTPEALPPSAQKFSRRRLLTVASSAAFLAACGGGTETGKGPGSPLTPVERGTLPPGVATAEGFPTYEISTSTPYPSATNPESDKNLTLSTIPESDLIPVEWEKISFWPFFEIEGPGNWSDLVLYERDGVIDFWFGEVFKQQHLDDGVEINIELQNSRGLDFKESYVTDQGGKTIEVDKNQEAGGIEAWKVTTTQDDGLIIVSYVFQDEKDRAYKIRLHGRKEGNIQRSLPVLERIVSSISFYPDEVEHEDSPLEGWFNINSTTLGYQASIPEGWSQIDQGTYELIEGQVGDGNLNLDKVKIYVAPDNIIDMQEGEYENSIVDLYKSEVTKRITSIRGPMIEGSRSLYLFADGKLPERGEGERDYKTIGIVFAKDGKGWQILLTTGDGNFKTSAKIFEEFVKSFKTK